MAKGVNTSAKRRHSPKRYRREIGFVFDLPLEVQERGQTRSAMENLDLVPAGFQVDCRDSDAIGWVFGDLSDQFSIDNQLASTGAGEEDGFVRCRLRRKHIAAKVECGGLSRPQEAGIERLKGGLSKVDYMFSGIFGRICGDEKPITGIG